jgi:hypothetical protein
MKYRKLRIAWSVLIVVALALVGGECAAEDRPAADSNRFASASELKRFYQKRLSGASDGELAEYRAGNDTGLALQAAWEWVAREAEKRSSETEGVIVSSLDSAQRFVGFAEGRLKVAPPKWWSKTLLDAEIDREADVSFGWHDAPPLSHTRTKSGIFTTNDWQADFSGEQLILSRKELHYTIPFPANDRLPKHIDTTCMSAEVVKGPQTEQLVVVIYGPVVGPDLLLCFDEHGAKQRWEASVWTMPPMSFGTSGPQMNHFVEIVPHGNCGVYRIV